MDALLVAVVVVVLVTSTAAGMGVTAGGMLLTGAAHVDSVRLEPAVLLLGAIVFALSSYVEELVFRALMLGGLVRLTGRPWAALAVMALTVGLFHLATTAHTTTLSVLSSWPDG